MTTHCWGILQHIYPFIWQDQRSLVGTFVDVEWVSPLVGQTIIIVFSLDVTTWEFHKWPQIGIHWGVHKWTTKLISFWWELERKSSHISASSHWDTLMSFYLYSQHYQNIYSIPWSLTPKAIWFLTIPFPLLRCKMRPTSTIHYPRNYLMHIWMKSTIGTFY